MHLSGGEIPPRTQRRIDFLVDKKLVVPAQQVHAKVFNQFFQDAYLFSSGFFILEIPDQANTDPMIIVFPPPDMAAVKLLRPAGSDFDLAVLRVAAVAYDKVVGQAVFHSMIAIYTIIGFRIPMSVRAMMKDDVLPFRSIEFYLVRSLSYKIKFLGKGPEQQFLPDINPVGLQPIRLFQIIDGYTESFSDACERIAFPDGTCFAICDKCGSGCEKSGYQETQ